MFVHADGSVTGSVNRAELAAAYAAATDEAARDALAAVGAAHGLTLEDDELVEPVPESEPEPASESERPTQADNKAAWVDWAVEHGLARDDAEQFTKAELIDEFGDKE